MRNNVRCSVFVLLTVFSIQAAEAQLFPRLRRLRNYSPSSVVSSGNKSQLPFVQVSYDYVQGTADEHEDRATVFLNVTDRKVPAEAKVEVSIADLSDSEALRKIVTPITVADGKARFVVRELEAEKVYRLTTVVHSPAAKLSKKTAIGAVPRNYYFATSSSRVVGKRRRQIVMSAFHYYYRFLAGKVGNMDCWAFCQKHSGRYTSGWTHRTHYGHQVPLLADKGPIFGDYVRIPDYHSLLLLAYDKKKQQVWTIEGNFNSSIVVVKRPVNSSWWVSHIGKDHVRKKPATTTVIPASSRSTLRRRGLFRRRG